MTGHPVEEELVQEPPRAKVKDKAEAKERAINHALLRQKDEVSRLPERSTKHPAGITLKANVPKEQNAISGTCRYVAFINKEPAHRWKIVFSPF